MIMPVAKSYENYEQLGTPFEENKKMYVKVKALCSRCGGSGHYSMNAMGDSTCYKCNGRGHEVKTVRWYTESQRATMDRAAEKRIIAKTEKQEERRKYFAARNAFGFGPDGYITLYKGDQEKIADYFKSFTIDDQGHRAAWYNLIFLWYTPSKIAVPTDIPEGIEPIRLEWSQVRDTEDPEDLQMRDSEEVKAYVKTLIYAPSKSEYQGEKNEWLERNVTVKKNIAIESHYGSSHMHILEDADGNIYVWTTASKNLEEGSTIQMKMKVKDHQEYNGTKQTIVYYCKVK